MIAGDCTVVMAAVVIVWVDVVVSVVVVICDFVVLATGTVDGAFVVRVCAFVVSASVPKK